MGAILSMSQISLIIITCILILYAIGAGVYLGTNKITFTSSPIFTSSPTSPPPIFTASPTLKPTSPVVTSPVITPSPTPSAAPHLQFNINQEPGPSNAPVNFYRLGCQAALSEGLFPFTEFNQVGTYNTGVLCDYYTYDTWGFGGNTNQVNCGGLCISGVTSSCTSTLPPASPNQPWTDEQCDICATAANDPNCLWNTNSSSCYTTVLRDPNVTFVPTYHGMDISQCHYNPQGEFNAMTLCCDPGVG